MKELELYIHIPFCVKKCDYCDFLSAPADAETMEAYVRKLCLEIAAAASYYKERQVTTIFIGGGTPSVLHPEQIARIMEAVSQNFLIQKKAEITMECNPGTITKDKLRALNRMGINRLSIGLQSADDAQLKLLGRIHTYREFVSNYESAREAGFENINIDVISGLPGQKLSSYEHTLKEVLERKPEHISAYGLIIEEGTLFYERYKQAERLRDAGKAQRLLPDEEEERGMYALTKEMLQDKGYERYEISNYALDGFCCRHNCGYWTRKDYLGLGLGAASLIDNERFCGTSDLKSYLTMQPAQSWRPGAADRWHENRQKLSRKDQIEEFMFLGMRMMRGVEAETFRKQFSCEIEEVYGSVFERQKKQGLVQKTRRGYCLTERGIDVSNYVLAEYLL